MKHLLSIIALGISLLLPSLSQAQTNQQIKRAEVPRYSHIKLDLERLVLIKGPIRNEMSEDIVRQIYNLGHNEDGSINKTPIFYVINTNGGSLMAGAKIVQAMESSPSPGVCVVDRAAFSMGAIILAHCKKAYIHKNAAVMFHEGYLRIEGQMSQMISFMQWQTNEFYKLTQELSNLLRLPVATFAELQKNEWWMNSEQVVLQGLAVGILEKLEYPEPERDDIFTILLGGGNRGLNWTPSDGVRDLTWYPATQNPYLTPVSGR